MSLFAAGKTLWLTRAAKARRGPVEGEEIHSVAQKRQTRAGSL
jgi:hypothetical protein